VKDVMALCWAAYQGDLEEIQRLVACGVNLNEADYDGRTCIHLAASEGKLDVVKFLIGQKINMFPKDRWGGTPLDDAMRHGHTEIIKILKTKEENNE
tara:strand:+ start:1676 stop:1966 length:291 start_codon:yes stop_codon:yes gene_type:complete